MNAEGDETLHGRILRELEGRILSGEWQPGHRLPSETELAAAYGCSRMTVNKVMTQLTRAGLIIRQRRAGTSVAQPGPQPAVLEIQDIQREVEASKSVYGYRLLNRAMRDADAGDTWLERSKERQEVLELICLHSADGQPFCLEERQISLAAAADVSAVDFSVRPPGQWLLDTVPWSAAEHTIRAVAASAQASRALGIAKGTPCLSVERKTWNAGRPVTRVVLTYPGQTHALTARFTPASTKPTES